MVSGELYLASDPELVTARARARELTGRYNAAPDPALLVELFASVGERVTVEAPVHCDYGWNVTLGDGVFLNFGCVLLDCAPITVGAGTMLGPYVQLCAATHPLAPREREAGHEYALPVAIGRNVWLAAGVVVGAGVTVGDDSVIGAGSVVVRDVPAGVLAAGNPCRTIREL